MLQVRMRVIGIDTRGAGAERSQTAILEPVRDASNEGIPEENRVAKGDHISGRLTLTFDTERAGALFVEGSTFVLTLAPDVGNEVNRGG